jgi:hypothetical protein
MHALCSSEIRASFGRQLEGVRELLQKLAISSQEILFLHYFPLIKK